MKNYADVCHCLWAYNPFKDWWAKDPVNEEEEEEEHQSASVDSSDSSNDESQQTSSSENQRGGYAKETRKRGCASTKPAPASSQKSASIEEYSIQELESADPPPSKRRCGSTERISCNHELSSPGFNDLQDSAVSHSSAGGDDAITLMALHWSAIPDAAVVVIATENGGSLALDLAENEQHLAAAGDEAESTHPAHPILSVYQPSPSQVPLISKEVETIQGDEQDIPDSIPWTEVWNSKEYVNSHL